MQYRDLKGSLQFHLAVDGTIVGYKDLDMMHYFLGMGVCQNADGISLGQGKYAVEILKRFRMMDCKAMTTPMASNLKLRSDASLEAVDATVYH